ncbi:MAG: hypothetical protein N4A72_12995 [Bacteroidales bacterium]|nr:hypothetical protein [Bacteroidales bacterium]
MENAIPNIVRRNIKNLESITNHVRKEVHSLNDIAVGLSKTTDKQKWLDNLKNGIYRNSDKVEYINTNGKILKWSDQTSGGISNSIRTKLSSNDLGDMAEGKVGDFLQKEGKVIECFGQKRLRGADGSVGAELDIVTKDEIIEVKNSIVAAKTKFVLNKKGKVGQAGKLVNKSADDFVNPHGKKPILYIDEPLPRQANGNLFPSDQAYIDALRVKGIQVVNSLPELKQILK